MNKKVLLTHPIPPLFDADSRVLILGSFPSEASREAGFFYAHPRNRFWRVLAAVLGTECPVTTEDKKRMLLSHGIALWDVIASCEIVGSSDASIRNTVVNDLSPILSTGSVSRIFLNGGAAASLYNRYIEPVCGIPAIKLPSTSAANAGTSFERLCGEWAAVGEACDGTLRELEAVLARHAEAYPLMRPEDAVKLVYQNEYGGGHLIRDREAALAYLLDEYGSIRQTDGELCESIGGGIVRVRLDALNAHGITPEELFDRFCKSASEIRGSGEGLERKLRILVRLTEEELFTFGREELDAYLAGYRKTDGAVRHSEAYRAAYHPAYRIVCEKYMRL